MGKSAAIPIVMKRANTPGDALGVHCWNAFASCPVCGFQDQNRVQAVYGAQCRVWRVVCVVCGVLGCGCGGTAEPKQTSQTPIQPGRKFNSPALTCALFMLLGPGCPGA